ncbi:hypothetical protein GCM10027275_53540 [Rhabdobacter roseus]|uniref:Uncharacterized protein n=1 Tax=Rhabdobacter roseus TaxID=1655419 RepID=A0A840TSQ8_9BACT|nr:hypothetical protein [Rhabdobacter roseus]MBB5287416.1 hypothetical protein [Rhabdobacter roseus]
MKNATRLIASFLLCLSALSFSRQTPFSACSAAFLNNKMIVNEYSPQGTCTVAAGATGQLTVCTAELSPQASKAIDKIDFKVAIRDEQTHTLLMYSDETYRQVDIQRVLSQCKKGDRIVLLTTSNLYALPHNEILVQ